MSFFLDHVERIIDSYKGNPPLSAFLKIYFKQYPKLGSRDRKALSEAAYIYYRSSRFLDSGASVQDVLVNGIIWCHSENVFLRKMMEPVLQYTSRQEPRLPDAFSYLVSPAPPLEEWLYSMWQQPRLFIRVRNHTQKIATLLRQHQIPFIYKTIAGNDQKDCICVDNGIAIDQWLPERDYVVQDWASQSSIYTLLQHLPQMPATVWDVCSGAGGKSILLKDKLPAFSLLASDIRESILHNLKLRFKTYNLGQADTLIMNSADAETVAVKMGGKMFDLVLCDVPCSGSGTWARTPEQFHFFQESNLQKFEALQYPIAFNASKHVIKGGTLAYITCSVFKKENEDVVARLSQTAGLQLIHQQLIIGIAEQADSLFIAVFRKL